MLKRLLTLSPIVLILLFSQCTGEAPKIEDKPGTLTIEDVKVSDQIDDLTNAGELYVSEAGAFQVAFPGEPDFSEESVSTEIGEMFLANYIYESSNSRAYMISYTDYPELIMEAAEPKDLLDGGMEGALETFGIDKEDEYQLIEQQGNPGIYFKANNKEDFFVRYKLVLKGSRLYQIAVLNNDEYAEDNEANAFLNSFAFLD